jgi:predicted RNase H-related nuclease YkuK (DUF458 family)
MQITSKTGGFPDRTRFIRMLAETRRRSSGQILCYTNENIGKMKDIIRVIRDGHPRECTMDLKFTVT